MTGIKKIFFPYRYKIKLLIIKYEIWVKMLEKNPYNKVETRIYKTVISDLKQLTKNKQLVPNCNQLKRNESNINLYK